MSRSQLPDALPELVREGLISAEQAERIRARYPVEPKEQSSKMLLVFAILGSLLVGLGIILIIAHNWDDLPRAARVALAFVPILLGQVLVFVAIRKQAGNAAWREGSALILACGLCACIALISQIYHISGSLEGYLLMCSFLILPLLYIPGSITVALGYLAMVSWYGWAVRFEHFGNTDRPWMLLLLLAAAVPFYFLEARRNGTGTGFWWLSLFMALTVGCCGMYFYTDWGRYHVLGITGLAAAFTLVPWTHRGLELRTWPWALIGGSTMLGVFAVYSFRPMWEDQFFRNDQQHQDWPAVMFLLSIGIAAYVLSLRVRKPLERWPYPEGLWLFLACFAVGSVSPTAAAIVVNLTLLLMGVVTVRRGIEADSLKRLNLGLTIIGITVLMRFFDADLSFVMRGLVFIALGCAFLFMNMRMLRQRNKDVP